MRSPARFLLFAACTLLLPHAARAADPLLTKAETLLREGKAEAAFVLLDPLESAQAGDPLYDYLLATACLNSGRLSQATFIYERILAVKPGYVGVRADMGRAYYMMGDLAKARIEFEAVLAFSNLPPDLRSAVQQYLAAIEQRARSLRTVVTGFVEVGPGRDSNVGSATSANPITLSDGSQYFLDSSSLRRSDRYVALGAGLDVVHAVNDRLSAYAGGELRGRGHDSVDSADFSTADGRAGLQYAGGSYVVRGGLMAGRYWLGGTATRDHHGINLEWRKVLGTADQLTIGGAATRYVYLPASLRTYDFDLYTTSLGWVRAFAPSTSGGLTVSLGTEEATRGRDDGDKGFWGLRGTVQHEFLSGLGSYLTAGYQKGRYNQTNATYGATRADRLADLTAGLVWTLQDRWSVRPQVSFTWNQSNLTIYEFDRRDASVVLRKDF